MREFLKSTITITGHECEHALSKTISGTSLELQHAWTIQAYMFTNFTHVDIIMIVELFMFF